VEVVDVAAVSFLEDYRFLLDVAKVADEDASPLANRALQAAEDVANLVHVRDGRFVFASAAAAVEARRRLDAVIRPLRRAPATPLGSTDGLAFIDDDDNDADGEDDGDDARARFTVHALGHCHIDTAWLWTYAETRRKTIRSWSTQLALLASVPVGAHSFLASQAQQYDWLRRDAPELFARLRAAAPAFAPVGGAWVEMDANLPSGEAMLRQFLYGQRFFRRHFGAHSREFFLPDTFGYSHQLPALMRAARMRRFVTQKLSWNLINKFPYSTFEWAGAPLSDRMNEVIE